MGLDLFALLYRSVTLNYIVNCTFILYRLQPPTLYDCYEDYVKHNLHETFIVLNL